MKLNRRSLLKLLGILPLAAVARTFGDAPKPARSPARSDVWVNPYKSRGTLMVMVGRSKFGKTRLAKFLAGRHGMYVMDDCERLKDPAADCEFLVNHGINVLAIVRADRLVSKNDTLMLAYGGVPAMPIMHQADWVFAVEGWGVEENTATSSKDFTWSCRTLKDRFGHFQKTWQWSTADRTTWPHINLDAC